MAIIETLRSGFDKIENQNLIDKEIDKWMEMNTDGIVLRNHYSKEEDLEKDWQDFMSQHYKLKCLSNNVAYRLYGMKNEDLYYRLKKCFINTYNDISQNDNSSANLQKDIGLDYKADKINQVTGYHILRNHNKDINELNHQIMMFRSMPEDKKNKSNTWSLQIYGKDNEERYYDLLPDLINKELPNNDDIAIYDSSLNEVVYYPEIYASSSNTINILESFRHSINESSSITEATLLFNEAMKVKTSTPAESNMKVIIADAYKYQLHLNNDEDYLGFAPALLLEEIQDLMLNQELGPFDREECSITGEGNSLTGVGTNNAPTGWWEDYKARSIGLRPSSKVTGQRWIWQILSLYDPIRMGKDNDNKTEEPKREMIKLGWNPALDPSTQREEASHRSNQVFRENLGYRFVDLTEMAGSIPPTETEANPTNTEKEKIDKGIFVIFTGKEEYEDLSENIAKVYVTSSSSLNVMRPINSTFLHNTLTLQELLEANKNVPFHISMYYLEFPDSMLSKMHDMFQFLSKKVNDFRFKYSILTGVINRLEHRDIANEKLFCAKILDMLIYAAVYGYMDPGGYLSINMLSSMMKKSYIDYIYRVYNGSTSCYNRKDVDDIIHQKHTEKLFSDELNEELLPYLQVVPIHEIATLPVDFDKDGSVLIKKRLKINAAEEYSKCHRLLMQYSKAKGYEAMKYYIAKLWYLNIILEKKIHNPEKIDKKTLSSYYKTRAHIISDFNKYMGEVLEQEPNFNFEDYYKQTPFDRTTLKISKTFIDKITDVVKSLFSPVSIFNK